MADQQELIELHMPCPNPKCSAKVLVALHPTTRSVTCPACAQQWNCLVGRARSQSGRIVEHGSSQETWRIRYHEVNTGTGEALLDFVGSRDIEIRSGDEFVCLLDPTSGAIRSFTNATLRSSWSIPHSSEGRELVKAWFARARPSVWPVYVVAAVIGAVSIPFLGVLAEWLRPPEGEGVLDSLSWNLEPLLLSTSIALLGLVTAWGLVRLRGWGWWFAVVWTSIFTAGFVLVGWVCLTPAEHGGYAFSFVFFIGPVGLITIILFAWILVTRRQLFFY